MRCAVRAWWWMALAVVAVAAALQDATDGDLNCTGPSCLDDDDPPCPPDSTLAATVAPEASTTASPVTSAGDGAGAAGDAPLCVCVPRRCVTPVCRHGSRLELKQRGSGAPGDCCDVYECVPLREKNCSAVVCPEEPSACPADSFRLPGRRGPRDCCSVPQGCQCLPRACGPPPSCPDGEEARLLRAGDGRPGSCCPEYDCSPPVPPSTSPPDGGTRPHVVHAGRSVSRGVRSHPPLAEVTSRSEAQTEENAAAGAVQACASDGRSLEHGLSLRKDECTVCACTNGSMTCHTRTCPPLPPHCHPTRVHGECCPVCEGAEESSASGVRAAALASVDLSAMVARPAASSGTRDSDRGAEEGEGGESHVEGGGGCVTASGRPVREGQRWQEDPCTTCECRGGARRCEAFMCQVACSRPRHDPRECCPVCDDWPAHCTTVLCPVACPFGYEADESGCNSCRCQQEPKVCPLDCPAGFLLDRQGAPLCRCAPVPPPACPPLHSCHKNCTHGFRVNRQGCPVCRCNQCRALRPPDCEIFCPFGFRTNERGCAVCKCKEAPIKLTIPENAVTSSCKTSDGDMRESGESWFDGCRQCYCLGGVEMCALLACPALNCTAPLFGQSGNCCPHCPDDPGGGLPGATPAAAAACPSTRVEGESWHADGCSRCVCRSGRVLCSSSACPPAPCSSPALPPLPSPAHSCCAECPLTHLALPSAGLDGGRGGGGAPCGGQRAHGATWREARECRSCVCVDGEARCFSERCPKPSCRRPLLLKNRCCPVCLPDFEASRPCLSGNVTYQEGEEWVDDQCTRCKCSDGQSICEPKKCVVCANPMTVPDQCCPICPEVTEYPTSALLHEWEYQLIIVIFLVVVIIVVVYKLYQCFKKRQLKMDISPKSCPNPAYNAYSHRNSFPPPRYISTDRQAKYKYVPTYDTQQFDLLKSSSLGASEKTALAPV